MLKVLLHLIRADLVLFLRGRLALFWTFAFPLLLLIMQMALFGGGSKLGPVSLALVDLDQTPASQAYLRQLRSGLSMQGSVGFKISQHSSPTDGRQDIVVTVPKGFAANVGAGQTTTLQLGGQQTPGPAFEAAYGLIYAMSDNYNLNGLSQPKRVQIPPATESSAPTLSYGLYLVTGLVGMVILSTGLMGFAGPLVAARESGMFRLYQLFPIKTGWVVVAWWLSRLVVTLLASLLMFAAALWFYGVRPAPSGPELAAALLMLTLGTGAFLSLGLLIASVSNSVTAASIFCNLLYFPLMFSGNLMIPVNGLPPTIRTVLDFMPLNAMVESLRHCLASNVQQQSELYSGLILLGMMGGCLALSVRRFSWVPRRG